MLRRLALSALTLIGCASESPGSGADADSPAADPSLADRVVASVHGADDLAGEWVLDERRGYSPDLAESLNQVQDQQMTITDDGRITASATLQTGDGAFATTTVMTYEVDGGQIVATPVSGTLNGEEVTMTAALSEPEVYDWRFDGDRLVLRKHFPDVLGDVAEDGGDVYRRVR